jgi:hypothetical protein
VPDSRGIGHANIFIITLATFSASLPLHQYQDPFSRTN